MKFSRQEYWSGMPFPTSGDLPNPGIEPVSLASPALAGRFFTTSSTWEALVDIANLPFKDYQFIIFLTVSESACFLHPLTNTVEQVFVEHLLGIKHYL